MTNRTGYEQQAFDEGRNVALALAGHDLAFARVQWICVWGVRAESSTPQAGLAFRQSSCSALSLAIDKAADSDRDRAGRSPPTTKAKVSFEAQYLSQWPPGELLDWNEPLPTDARFAEGFKVGMVEAYARELF